LLLLQVVPVSVLALLLLLKGCQVWECCLGMPRMAAAQQEQHCHRRCC
jgi:hypothetical protein